MSMRANIATARRNRPKMDPLPHPHAHEARTSDGRVCPACLRFGRAECKAHRDAIPPSGDRSDPA